jgi:hypothetical protein
VVPDSNSHKDRTIGIIRDGIIRDSHLLKGTVFSLCDSFGKLGTGKLGKIRGKLGTKIRKIRGKLGTATY